MTPRQIQQIIHDAMVAHIRRNSGQAPVAVASVGDSRLEIDSGDGSRAVISIEIYRRQPS